MKTQAELTTRVYRMDDANFCYKAPCTTVPTQLRPLSQPHEGDSAASSALVEEFEPNFVSY